MPRTETSRIRSKSASRYVHLRRKRSYLYSRGQYGKCKYPDDQTDDRECIRGTGSDHVCNYGSEHPSTSSAEGEKLGDLSFAQEVHVTGRDKNTGWYRIEHDGGSAWVSDSYLSDSKPTVRTPSNNQQSASQSKAAADSNAAADCNCDCGSDCDCASDCQADCVCMDCDCSACEPATDCLNCDDSVTFCDCGDCWISY